MKQNWLRNSFIFLAFATATLTSFAQNSTNSTSKTSSAIVGTWQRVSVDQQVITNPFFMRFYTNGLAATWPAPSGFSIAKGVSYGGYHFEGAFLVIETGAGKNDPKTKIEIRGDEMTMISDETNRLIYHRIVPDLQPGKFLPGHPSHGPPDL
jgi:hypothetical protein